VHINNPPAKDIFNKCEYILKAEGIQYDKKTLVELVKKCYPDIRKTFVFLRQNINNGKLNETIELSSFDKLFEEILSGILSKDPEKVRKILKSSSVNYQALYGFLYDKIMDSVEDDVFKDDASAILLIAEATYRDNQIANKEINLMHMVFQMLKNGVI
jgi:DNA polymerase III delta prime subunit